MNSTVSKPYFTLEDAVVPMQLPRVLVETARGQGAALESLLKGTGLSRDVFDNPRARISYAQYGTLALNALEATGNPSLGLDFGNNIHLGNLGMLGLSLLTSSTAKEALDVALTYARVVSPGFAVGMREEGDDAVLSLRTTVPMGPIHRFAVESTLACLRNAANFLLQGAGKTSSHGARLRLDYPAPEYAERYRELTSATISWNAPAVEVLFPRAVLDLPLGFGDPLTNADARRHCDFELSQLPGTGLLEQVRALLGKTPGEYLSLQELARELGTSSRSLRRALSRLGSSYQTLLFEVRREHALDFIRSPHLSVEGLAQKLGFSDARAFRRAFKRWTGYTPSDYRDVQRKQRSQAPEEDDGDVVAMPPRSAAAEASYSLTAKGL